METATNVIGGFGVVGSLVAFFLAGLFLAVLPIWSIVDCAVSKRDQTAKTLFIVLLCLTWGLGSLVYSLFLAESATLRRFSLISIATLLVLFVVSVASCVYWAKETAPIQEKRAAEEHEKLLADLRARGFIYRKGQVITIEDDVKVPTYFEAQVFKLIGNTSTDIIVKAQTCEIFGTVNGNLTFKGQGLTIQPRAIVTGNLDADAQVLKTYGKVMGNITGKVQVHEK